MNALRVSTQSRDPVTGAWSEPELFDEHGAGLAFGYFVPARLRVRLIIEEQPTEEVQHGN